MQEEQKPKKILIIEDDVFLGDLLVQKLQLEGYETELINDGVEGLKQISVIKPDLVLLDITIPLIDGYQILDVKQKDPFIAYIPIVVISNSSDPMDIERAHALGAREFLVKAHFDLDQMIAKIRPFLIERNDGSKKYTANRLAGRTILWAEDDQFLADVLAPKLSAEGCKTLLYTQTGEDALERLKTERPDVIILDVMLPKMSGYDVLQAVKADAHTKDIPVILLSNLAKDADIERSKSFGAVKHLIKSQYNLDEVIDEIAGVFKNV